MLECQNLMERAWIVEMIIVRLFSVHKIKGQIVWDNGTRNTKKKERDLLKTSVQPQLQKTEIIIEHLMKLMPLLVNSIHLDRKPKLNTLKCLDFWTKFLIQMEAIGNFTTLDVQNAKRK